MGKIKHLYYDRNDLVESKNLWCKRSGKIAGGIFLKTH